MSLMDGGRGGEFYQDLLDYFYYAQLRANGVDSTQPREITGYINVEEVVNLMRALGFYPTEEQVRDIKTEVRYAHHGYSPAMRNLVDLEEFIRMYVNYRPVFGLQKEQFAEAFKLLAAPAPPADGDGGGGR